MFIFSSVSIKVYRFLAKGLFDKGSIWCCCLADALLINLPWHNVFVYRQPMLALGGDCLRRLPEQILNTDLNSHLMRFY